MSMALATRVDVARDPSSVRWSGRSHAALRTLIEMSPIAAYYVMVVTDHERAVRKPRYDSIVPKVSLAGRIVAGLEALLRLGRPATTYPI
jgi:hypothetical protein